MVRSLERSARASAFGFGCGEAGGFEEHDDEAGVDDAVGVRVLGDPFGCVGLDRVDLCEQLLAGLGQLRPALGVELCDGACEVGVGAVKAAGGGGGVGVGGDLLQER